MIEKINTEKVQEKKTKKVRTEEYEEGLTVCIKDNGDVTKTKNPYPKNSEKWKQWNRGWNRKHDELTCLGELRKG
jgi:hypothetical protein